MNDHFHAGDAEYRRDLSGAIHQVNPKPYTYDPAYIDRTYGSIPEQRLTETAFLRLGVLLGRCPKPTHLLDWGYGCGAFLKAAATIPGCDVHGYDINGIPPPHPSSFCDNPMAVEWSVVTFYDVLEHIHDLSFLRHLKASQIVVTVPYCHAGKQGWEWFRRWKHRKPDEHVHHWDAVSLITTLRAHGWTALFADSPEDCTRRGLDSPNILTVIAHRSGSV